MSKILVVFAVLLGIVQHGNAAVQKCAFTENEILDTTEEPYAKYSYKNMGGSKGVYDSKGMACLEKCFKSAPEVNYAELESDKRNMFRADFYCRCFKSVPGSARFKKVSRGFSMHCWVS